MEPVSRDLESRDGLTLSIRERAPPDADEAVLFVHGAMTNARALFDTPVEGDGSYSWMRAAADLGRAAFALDVRGYGDSDRPPELSEPPEANDPPVRADLAANDVGDAAAFVRERFGRLHLVGVSWGTTICGRYVERDDPDVASLSQCAPVYEPGYDAADRLETLGLESIEGAYYYQERDVVETRQGGDPELFEAIWRAQVESNQGVDGGDAYVAQTGALADWVDACDGDPPYDASGIDVPTLILRGTDDVVADREAALTHYDDLTVEDDLADYVELAGVDHYPMHGRRRRDLFETVSAFQDRVSRPSR